MRRAFRFRLRILAGALALFALLLVGRLYYVQIIQGATYAARGERQYISSARSSTTAALFISHAKTARLFLPQPSQPVI